MSVSVSKPGGANKIKYRSPSDIAFQLIVTVFCAAFVIIILYPLYFVVLASFSDPRYVSTGQVVLWFKGFTLAGYDRIFRDARIWLGYRNTLFYSLVGTAINLLVTLPCAYSLSRKDFLLQKPLMVFFTITMFFSGGLVPTYLVVSGVGFENTIWAILIPFCFSVYNAIIARTFFQTSIPHELFEAAQIEGCSNWRYFIKIVMPLSQPIIMVLMLYYRVGRWNDYFQAMIYLRDENLYPLQLHLRSILLGNQALEQGTTAIDAQAQVANMIKYGVVIVSSLPLLLFYPLVQRYFAKGVMIGALKG